MSRYNKLTTTGVIIAPTKLSFTEKSDIECISGYIYIRMHPDINIFGPGINVRRE